MTLNLVPTRKVLSQGILKWNIKAFKSFQSKDMANIFADKHTHRQTGGQKLYSPEKIHQILQKYEKMS